MRGISYAAVLLLAVLAACGGPTLEEVRVAFKRAHPGCEVLSVEYPSDKDAPANAYRVKYRRPGDPAIHVVMWKYDPPIKSAPGNPSRPIDPKPQEDPAKLPEAPRPHI